MTTRCGLGALIGAPLLVAVGVTPSSYLTEQPVSEGLQVEHLNGTEIERIQTRQDWIVVKPCCLKSRRAASLVSRGERPRKAGHLCSTQFGGRIDHRLAQPGVDVRKAIKDFPSPFTKAGSAARATKFLKCTLCVTGIYRRLRCIDPSFWHWETPACHLAVPDALSGLSPTADGLGRFG